MAFKPGESGNPNGRPKRTNEAALKARAHTEKAIQRLVDALDDVRVENQIKAAESLLSRGWGKPQEFVELSSDPDAPLSIEHNIAPKILGMIPTETLQKFLDDNREHPDND